ncbi:TetR/AcrR family transcriptional regulator [Vibrio sp.]|uniref:TetR/AcrR family transcriptional regulator n=1 Tax=Vibrio sp. TaxID=678 RepID=UPI003AA846BC
MARRSNFNKDEKLIEAMQLFWQQGYANTSISDLVEHLAINRFSLYNTFGDKHALYINALNYYFENISKPAAKPLFDSNANLETLTDFLLKFSNLQKSQQFGCFIQNALLEHANRDQDVQLTGRCLFTHLSDGVTSCLNHAKAQGQLSESMDISSLTDLILTQIQGMRVLGKAKQYDRLDNATNMLIRILNANKKGR